MPCSVVLRQARRKCPETGRVLAEAAPRGFVILASREVGSAFAETLSEVVADLERALEALWDGLRE